MAEFKGVSEKFRVRLVDSGDNVVCQVGLDGLFILSTDGYQTLRKFPLNHIARWALRGSSLVLYTRTPADVEERSLTLQGDDRTIRSLLDTLTCCCMQMVELLETSTSSTDNDRAVAESLSAMINSKKKVLTADEVEFWTTPEKSGWMYSQGEVIKTWRRRWFVLKSGFLFRFADTNVQPSSKPRGIVNLTSVQDVSNAREATGKPNSLRLSTSTGQVCYLIDSETEQVEWLSALEGAVAKIVRSAAGVDDEAAAAAAVAAAAKPAAVEQSHNSNWARKLEAGFSSVSKPSSAGSRRSGANGNGNPMVKVVGFSDTGDGGPPAYGSGGGGTSAYGGGGASEFGSGGAYSDISGYGKVAGAREAPDRQPASYRYNDYPPAHQQHQQQHGAYSGNGTNSHAADIDRTSWGGPAPAVQSDMHNSQYAPPGQHQSNHYQTAPPAQQQEQYQPPQHQGYSTGYGGGAQSFDTASGRDAGGYGGEQQSMPAGPSGAPDYIMDSVPQQQPASYYQSLSYSPAAQAPPQPQPQPEPSQWQIHTAPDGRPYWHNAATNITQWEQPAS